MEDFIFHSTPYWFSDSFLHFSFKTPLFNEFFFFFGIMRMILSDSYFVCDGIDRGPTMTITTILFISVALHKNSISSFMKLNTGYPGNQVDLQRTWYVEGAKNIQICSHQKFFAEYFYQFFFVSKNAYFMLKCSRAFIDNRF